MPHLEIVSAGERDAETLAALAKQIWREHYTAIIGAEQVEYMTDTFQSPAAILEQIRKDGYRYSFFDYDGTHAGYMGVQVKNNALYLSKLYVAAAYRRKHIAQEALSYLIELCQKEGISNIWLTVNKNNSGSVAAYEALGFIRTRSQVADIGGGYVMDDYIYEMKVKK